VGALGSLEHQTGQHLLSRADEAEFVELSQLRS
jgi:hypothetical protein